MPALPTPQKDKDMLRFLTCGSVDDGKSTLIGRLLYDCDQVSDDALDLLKRESKKIGRAGDTLDYSLLVDGLMAEREQGITIDVAYRYFSTPARKFIVADTPGHEQYTRNMATGASTSDLAVLLVDARAGLLTQTRRHASIVALMGISQLVLAVNKMDLVDFEEAAFRAIERDFAAFADKLGGVEVTAIPVSARGGDNIATSSASMPWYKGPCLLSHLETVQINESCAAAPLRLPIQLAIRPGENFRGYGGMLASGTLAPGDAVRAVPSGQVSHIARLVGSDEDLQMAQAGESVTVTLADEIDLGRGDVLCAADDPLEVSDQMAAHILWMHEKPLLPGRKLEIRLGAQSANVTISALKYIVSYDSLEHLSGRTLGFNDTGFCNISIDRPLVFDAFKNNRTLGSFILVDKMSNETVGAGMIAYGLRRADNVHWQALDVDKRTRAGMKGQKPCVLWFTGLSGSGKSTIANRLEKLLMEKGAHTYLLDGDNVRHGLNRDLGFTDADRVENIRRVGETARLMVDAGLIVLVSFISPFRAERQMARALVDDDEFLEIFVDTPLAVCEARDTKGLYKKARAGEIKNFTGIDSAYEEPQNADIRVQTETASAQDLAQDIFEILQNKGYL